MTATNPREKTPRALCLAGPTGAGKTALALRLCRELDGEVVNADSRQVYRDFPVIAAAPSPEERAVCPHHLYGYLPTESAIDVNAWQTAALEKVRDIQSRGKVAVLVGGTGMYFQILLRGIADIPAVDEALRAELKERIVSEGSPAMHAELARLDPELAARLHPNDTQRVLRGLEVALGTPHPLTWWHANAARSPALEGPLLTVNTPLAELEGRLRLRIELMLKAGALDEARAAWAACPVENAPGWTGIGCREVLGHLLGRTDLATAKELWLRNTRAYAKRQITWFRGRRESLWIAPDDLNGALGRWRDFTDGRD